MIFNIANLYLNVCKTFLTIVGFGIAISLNAQVPSQNLFRRAQLLEYQRIKNQSRIRNERVEFPLMCSLPAKEQGLWSQAESFFAYLQWKDASKLYSAFIQQDSSFCDAYFRLAQCYVARNDLARAHNLLQIAKRKFSKNPLLYLGLGQLYTLLGYPREALRYYEEQIKLFPNDPEGFLGGSMALCDLDRNEEAIDYLEKGKKLLTARI